MYQSLSGRSMTALTSLKLHDLSKIVVSSGPWASDSDTHTVRSNAANPLTRKSYDTITGSDETTIHAGDHFGDYYDHRTTFNTARKNNLTWVGIGADTLSRTVAGLALNALSWYLAPGSSKGPSAQARYAATETSSTSAHAHAATPEGRGKMKQAKALSADTRAFESDHPADSSVKWITKCIKCSTTFKDDEWTNEKAQCERKHIEPSTQQQLLV